MSVSSEHFRLGWFALSRVYLAQIVQINEKAGTVNVVISDGLASEKRNLEIPWSGFSANGHKSSWIRYMPQLRSARNGDDNAGGDLVYVAFSVSGEARIIGFATRPGDYARFTSAKTKSSTEVPSGDFADLRQGEWDMRSSGGAYIYGNRDGHLLLSAGGTVRVRLDKNNNEGRLESGLWVLGSEGSYARLGDVKRLIPGTYKETVSTAASVAPKEWRVHLENPLSVPVPIADHEFGAVLDVALPLPVPAYSLFAPVPEPLRERKRIYSVDGLVTSYESQIDVLGNHQVQYADTALKVKIDGGSATQAEAAFNSVQVTTTTNASIVAGAQATLQGQTAQMLGTSTALVEALAVKLGALAVQPAVHGTQLVTILQSLTSIISTLAAVVPGGGAAIATALQAVNALIVAPPGPTGLLSSKVKVE